MPDASRLTPEEQSIEDQALHALRHSFDAFASQYIKEFGTTLDADLAKELFAPYNADAASRRQWASAVYRPAQELVDELLRRLLLRTPGPGVVLFTAGGPGVGKSSALASAPARAAQAVAIMDGTLSDPARAIRNIDLVLSSGKQVFIAFTTRNFEQTIHGVIDRALDPENGRIVPLEVSARKYCEAHRSIRHLTAHYADHPKVTIRFARNTPEGAQSITLDQALQDLPDLDHALQTAYRIGSERRTAARPDQAAAFERLLSGKIR